MNNYFNYLSNNQSCVLLHNHSVIYESYENSVKPLVKYVYYNQPIESNTILVDKIIGYAIANVILYSGIKTVYAKTISKPALDLLKKHNVQIEYQQIVDNILRRDRTDLCPMEKKILTTQNSHEAFQILVEIVINQNLIHLS